MKAEGQVRVGIAKKKQLKVIFHSAYMSDGKCFVGEHLFSSDSAERLFLPADDDASFTLENVVIGVDFHWERAENQTFCGALQLLEESGFIWAVNILPVETYLTSVISSEIAVSSQPESAECPCCHLAQLVASHDAEVASERARISLARTARRG